MRGRKSISTVLFCIICLSGVCSLTAGGESVNERDTEKAWFLEKEEAITVIGDIRVNNYPINEMKQTYGRDIKDSEETPDLILVENGDGVLGYIRAEDLNGPNYRTPEEALMYQTHGRNVDMYLSDGVTNVGEFYIGNKKE